MSQLMDLQRIDRDILGVLAEGRATPKLLTDSTDHERYEIQRRMDGLRMGEYVTKVSTGLYEITDKGRTEVEDPRE